MAGKKTYKRPASASDLTDEMQNFERKLCYIFRKHVSGTTAVITSEQYTDAAVWRFDSDFKDSTSKSECPVDVV